MGQSITKIALVVKDSNDNILVLKKRGLEPWILPGGKPHPHETHGQTLHRECMEELCVEPLSASFLMTCQDTVADTVDDILRMHVYYGEMPYGKRLYPSEEIEYLLWVPVRDWRRLPVAPSLRNTVMPFLCRFLDCRDFLDHNIIRPETLPEIPPAPPPFGE